MQLKHSLNLFVKKFIIFSIIISINVANVKADGFWTGIRDDYIAPAAIKTKNFLWDLIGIKEDHAKHVVILEVKSDNEFNSLNKSEIISQTNSINNPEVSQTNNAEKTNSEPDKPKDLVQITTEMTEKLGKIGAEKLPKEGVLSDSNTNLSQDHQNSNTQQFQVQPNTSTDFTTNPSKSETNLLLSPSNADSVSKIDLKNLNTQPENFPVVDKTSEKPHSTKQVEQFETPKHSASSIVDNHLHLQEKESDSICPLGTKLEDGIKSTVTIDDKNSSSLTSQFQILSSGNSHSLQLSKIKPVEHSSSSNDPNELMNSKVNFMTKDQEIDNKIISVVTDQSEVPVKDGHESSERKVDSAQPENENQHEYVPINTDDDHEDDKNHWVQVDEGELHRNDQLLGQSTEQKLSHENSADINRHLQDQFHESLHSSDDLNPVQKPNKQSNFQFDLPFPKKHFKSDHQFEERRDQFPHHWQEEKESSIHEYAEHHSELHENYEREEQVHHSIQFEKHETSANEEEIDENHINYEHEHLLEPAKMEGINEMKSVKDGHEPSERKVDSVQPVNENQQKYVPMHTGDDHEDDQNYRGKVDEGELHRNDQSLGQPTGQKLSHKNSADFKRHLQDQIHESLHSSENFNPVQKPDIQSNFQFDLPFSKEHFEGDHQFEERRDQFPRHWQEEKEGSIHEYAKHHSKFNGNSERKEQVHQSTQFEKHEPGANKEEINENHLNYEHEDLLEPAKMEGIKEMKSKNKINPNSKKWKIV